MRRSLAAAVVLLALVPSAFLAWHARDLPHLGYFHDDSLYLAGAKSLAEGNGYRIASFPDAPFQTKYPPLYPLLLSAVWRISPSFPANLPLAMLLAWLMVPLYVLAARVAFGDLGVPKRETWLLCAFVGVNPYVGLVGVSLFSELPFTALLIGSLALAERARRGPAWLAWAGGLVAGLAFLTRIPGVLLLFTVPLVLLLDRRARQALWYVLGMAPAVLGWILWTHTHRIAGADPTLLYYTDYLRFYLRDLNHLPAMWWHNLDVAVRSFGGLLAFQLGRTFPEISVARLLTAGALVGIWRMTRSTGRISMYAAFAAAYAVLILAWNYTPDQRYLIPIFPVLLAGLASEVKHILRAVRRVFSSGKVPERVIAGAIVALFAAFLGFSAWGHVYAYGTQFPWFVQRHRAALAGRKPVYDWIASHVPAQARFLTDLDPVLYLHTGRPALRMIVAPVILYEEDAAALACLYRSAPEYARSHGLTHLLLTAGDLNGALEEPEREAAWRAFHADPRMRLLFETKSAVVYRLN